MRESMERFSILPFSIGCVSHSSVDVIENHPKKPHRESNSSPPSGEVEEKLKGSLGLAHLPKANIGEKLNKLVKGFKSLPQRLQVHREEEEEEEDVELEIGFPTDVQHIGHIGWDGSNSNGVSDMKSWDRPPELMSIPFPSLALRQFELAVGREDGASV